MSELLTVSEVAEILGVGEDTVTRRFARVQGVIDLGSPENPKRRRYRVLRIPKTVVEKYLRTRSGGVCGQGTAASKAEKGARQRGMKTRPSENEKQPQPAPICKQHG